VGLAFGQDCSSNSSFVDRPISLGISGGNLGSIASGQCCSGTLGALVQDSKRRRFILSNNHVLARTSGHQRGVQSGEEIVQPGLVDNGCNVTPTDAVATLSRWVPLNFKGHSANSVDAAIARIIDGKVDPTGSILNIGPVPSTIIRGKDLMPNLHVRKMGRTTCETYGFVSAIEVTIQIAYAPGCGAVGTGIATFKHQIIVNSTAFSGPGDSGSLVVVDEVCPRAVGLLFAGSADGSLTVLNPIDRVLNQLGVKMVAGCTQSASRGLEYNSGSVANSAIALRRSIADAMRAKTSNEERWLKIPGVVGAGVGLGSDGTNAELVVFVDRNAREARAQVPSRIEGVPVTIIEAGEFRAL
jgi:hypothetical protein